MIRKIKNLPMQKKMMLTFAVPVIVLCGLILSICYPILNQKYKSQIQYSVNQSCTQAIAFLESYVQNMRYLSEMVGSDAELQRILNTEEFGQKKPLAEEYREFSELSQRLTDIELSNPLFRIGVYVPDDVFYSVNHQFVYPESELFQEPDYERMRKEFNEGRFWFTTGKERNLANVEETYETLVMYTVVYSAYGDAHELCVSKVSTNLDNLRKVLKNANITKKGITYLVNEEGKVLFSSEKSTTRSAELNREWQQKGKLQNMENIRLGGQEYFVVCQPMSEMDWDLVALIPTGEIAQQGYMVSEVFVIVGIGTLLIVLLSSWLLSKYYVSRLVRLRSKMKDLQQGDMNTGFALDERTEKGDEISEIYFDFNYMVERLRKLMQQHYRMGKSVKASELKALQAQINPHFLYNTLDLINWMAMDYGATEIADIAYNLAKFYRLSLNHGKNILTIHDELDHVRAYVEIENFHFEQAVHLEMHVSEEIQELACPNIILQPFVENAIVHGIAEFPEITECNITITAYRQENDVEFAVCDDGKGIPKEQMEDVLPSDMKKSSKGYGVKNINFRLKLYYGEKYGVSYENTQGEGTKVRIKIPAMSVQEMEKMLNE